MGENILTGPVVREEFETDERKFVFIYVTTTERLPSKGLVEVSIL